MMSARTSSLDEDRCRLENRVGIAYRRARGRARLQVREHRCEFAPGVNAELALHVAEVILDGFELRNSTAAASGVVSRRLVPAPCETPPRRSRQATLRAAGARVIQEPTDRPVRDRAFRDLSGNQVRFSQQTG
jgi:hypothetical protein